MTDKESFATKWVCDSVGLPETDLHLLEKFGAVRNTDGTWAQASTVNAMLAFQRDRWEWTSNQELAEIIAVAKSRISHLIRDDVLSQDASGRMPRMQNLRELIRHFQAESKKKHDTWDDKLEITRLDKELKQIEVDKARDKALEAVAVEKAWTNIVMLVRQRVLRIPNKVAPRLVFCKTETEMETELQKEVDEVLTELSRQPDYQVKEENQTQEAK